MSLFFKCVKHTRCVRSSHKRNDSCGFACCFCAFFSLARPFVYIFFQAKKALICVNDINAVHELYNEINVTPSHIIHEFLLCFVVQRILLKNFQSSSVRPPNHSWQLDAIFFKKAFDTDGMLIRTLHINWVKAFGLLKRSQLNSLEISGVCSTRAGNQYD